jgi:FkbM family methyltransferase
MDNGRNGQRRTLEPLVWDELHYVIFVLAFPGIGRALYCRMRLPTPTESTSAMQVQSGFLQRCKTLACRINIKLNSIVAPRRVGRTFFGHRFRCDIRDFIQVRIYFFHIWEPRLTSFMQQRIKAGDTVVDVGANIGYFSCLMSNLVGETGQVLAIEASPGIFSQLTANVQENGCSNVQMLNLAVWERPGEITMYLEHPRNQGRTTLLAQSSGAPVGTIRCDRLVNILSLYIEDISFIKVDVEGAERPVLEDILANVSRFKRPLNVVAEISPNNADLIAEFAKSGFDCFRLENVYDVGFYMAARAKDPAALDPCLKPIAASDGHLDGDYVFVLR